MGQGGAGGSASVCGNGVIEPGETCDDGDMTNGDGCSATCVLEPGTACGNAVDLTNPAVVTVTSGVTTYAGTTAGSMVTTYGAPTCSIGTSGAPRVIHRYRTGASQTALTIDLADTQGGLADTVVWAYLDCLDTTSELACDDDSGPGNLSAVTTPVLPPDTNVFIVVSGFDAAGPGPYTLRVKETPVSVVPASGTCAAPVLAGPGTFTGETLAGGPSALAGAACFTGAGSPESVFHVALATTSDLHITAAPSAPDFDIGAYVVAAPCASGAEVACVDEEPVGSAEATTLKALPAGSYYVVVDGYTSTDYGPYSLSIDVVSVLAQGAACDPASTSARCADGTYCVGPAGSKTCSAPSSVFSETFNAGLGAFTAGDFNADMHTFRACVPFVDCAFTNTTGSQSGGSFALVKDENNVVMDGETLTSPAINAAAFGAVLLEFDHAFDHEAGSTDLARVDVSTDLAMWTPVTSFTSDASGHVVIDISAYAAAKPTLYVRFFFDDQTGAGPSWVNDWRIDDVRVLGF
jgi:cysteine-rich repeat protein